MGALRAEEVPAASLATVLPQQWVDSSPTYTHFINKWNGNARSASGLGEYLGALRFSHGKIFNP